MSGIAGVLAMDGAPAERALLERMTDALAFRAPDGGDVWAAGPVALGHALLRTSAGQQAGPVSLGGCSIVADLRIDARAELVAALVAAGERVDREASDATLVLHAYRAWGTACVERLVGDFSFALWDAERRRLFCARDPFGVKLFYHARAGHALVFGNTLEVVRMHPGISDRPNDLAVADFLLIGSIHDPHATAFAEVRALPPAHAMTVEDGRTEVRRYYALPRDGEIRHRRVTDYAEHFREVFGRAVADRIRRGPAGVMMSGGRDSTAIAAAAVEGIHGADLRAFTVVYERLLPDREGEYAAMAAAALGISLELHPVDDYALFRDASDPRLRRPEPTGELPFAAASSAYYRRMLGHARVALTGLGADAVLAESHARLARLAARGRLLAAAREAAEYAYWHRRLPRPGFRSWLRQRRGGEWRPPYPRWLSPELEARLKLRERFGRLTRRPASDHPLRPEAHVRLTPNWSRLLEQYDPGVLRLPLESRHPFFDVRVVAFLLAIPPAQWYNDKGLLRIAYGRRFPAAFQRRQKTPLAGDSLEARLRANGGADLAGLRLSAAVAGYVDVARVPRFAGGEWEGGSFGEAWLHLRPAILSLWMQGRWGG